MTRGTLLPFPVKRFLRVACCCACCDTRVRISLLSASPPQRHPPSPKFSPRRRRRSCRRLKGLVQHLRRSAPRQLDRRHQERRPRDRHPWQVCKARSIQMRSLLSMLRRSSCCLCWSALGAASEPHVDITARSLRGLAPNLRRREEHGRKIREPKISKF